jgi:hypothetical protein
MPHHARSPVVEQHARDLLVRFLGAVADHHHAGVLRIAHADAAAVVQADPGRAARGVEQGVQQWPVADGVAAVAHRFGLAVGRGHRAAIEVVAADHDRRFQFALAHHLVEGQARAVAVAQAYPADARRQALEGDALAGHVEPAVQRSVLGEQLLHLRVGLADVFRVARQRHPAERADAAAEQGPDVGRHEAGDKRRRLHAEVLRHLAQVVAVVHRGHAHRVELQHRPHVHCARFTGGLLQRGVLGRVLLRGLPLFDRPAAAAGSR